ncbi:type I restriction enzyme, S subunit [Pelagirhabdus alkalitolerans]|uniref:Type I restriction enzyme, S subunit n=1 Tax=Pelagirhabdus alkalitolerans TaxID=1612202 RepID=A0A1G6MZG2_9BACI|nr:restriction endonuclease subunit S [Pelagirhabdus alkalitolerans]SDC60932.1 type I restriction enzyme, S subunit [Pelagirhabdus alkalitolerans]
MYSQYKKSGLEWFGDIPNHWEVVSLKKNLENIIDYRGKTPTKVDSGIFLVTAKNIQNGSIQYEKSKEYVIPSEYSNIMSRGTPKIGDVLLTTEAPLGEVANVDCSDIALAQRIIKLRGNSKLNNYFLKYFLLSDAFTQYLNTFATGSTALGIKGSKISMLKIILPPFEEQKKIINFLNQKTAEIDALIADKERLIELLEEKRQAVITETITKGLDSNVKMKDSGVEWIGEVPEHWEVKKMKYLFNIKKRIEGLDNPQILSVTQKGIKVKDISTNEGQLAANYDKYQTVDPGDFVMNHMDLLTGFIDVSIFYGVTSPDYRVFKITNENYNKDYFLYYFQMCYYLRIFYKFGQGVASFGRWRLSTDEFNSFPIPIPSVKEQREIIEFINNNEEYSKDMIKDTKETINKLKEYRQSIIYEAVTGKIDVSDHDVPVESDPEEVSQ